MTAKEIINKLSEIKVPLKDLDEGYWVSYEDNCEDKPEEDLKKYVEKYLGKYKKVENIEGEWQGNNYSIVLHFIDHDIYLRADAYYSSWEGVMWDKSDGLYEVEPKEKTIIVYNKKNK